MGPWCALWVLLSLPRALKGQTSPTRTVRSSVSQSFQETQFQGEWFVLGLAGSTHKPADRSLLNPFTATFMINENNLLEVAYAMIRRGQRCVIWSYVLILGTQPGKFSVDHSGVRGPDPEELQVHDTDYASWACACECVSVWLCMVWWVARRRSGTGPLLLPPSPLLGDFADPPPPPEQRRT
uniref:Lipocalin/cytosolic fatty-acid binding domain-containing protein n=1 Tax=Balaenoptera musculus TaxID=9771 RepID=A0A8C0CQ00_BALMU